MSDVPVPMGVAYADASTRLPMTGVGASMVRASFVEMVTATLLAACGVIHLVMVPGHMGLWAPEGMGFAVAGWVQIALAAVIAARQARRWVGTSIVVNTLLIAVWVVSRTRGLPIGPHADHAESIGLVDGVTVAMEALAALAAVVAISAPHLRIGGSQIPRRRIGALIPLAVVVATTTVLVSPSARTHAHDVQAGSSNAAAQGVVPSGAAGAVAGHGDHPHPPSPAPSATVDGVASAPAAPLVGVASSAGAFTSGVGPASGVGAVGEVEVASDVAGQQAAGHQVAGHQHGADGVHPAGTATAAPSAEPAAGTPAADDLGFSLLMNGHQHTAEEQPMDGATTAALAHQLARTAELVALYPDVAAAEAAGYRRQGPFAPGLGTHYGTIVGAAIDEESVLRPMLIYDGAEPTSKLIGFMYIAFGVDGMPEGFVGPNDIWHYHTNVCVTWNEDGSVDAPFGADRDNIDAALCESVGGRLIENTGYMLHVWTVPGYENPLGVFHETHPDIRCADGTYYTKDPDILGDSLSFCADAP